MTTVTHDIVAKLWNLCNSGPTARSWYARSSATPVHSSRSPPHSPPWSPRSTSSTDSLDIAWLKDDSTKGGENLPESAARAVEAMGELEAALEELRSMLAELGENLEQESAE